MLAGRVVRLEPLAPGHADDLWEASRDPRVWRWLPVLQPQTRAEWDAWMDVRARADGRGSRARVRHRARRRGKAAGLDPLPLRSGPSTGALEIGWTWLTPTAWATRRQRRGEAAPARVRLRDPRLPPGRVQDGRPQRAGPSRPGGAAGPVRGHSPQAHARPRRHQPRLGLVQRPRRRVAGRPRDALRGDASLRRDAPLPVPPAALRSPPQPLLRRLREEVGAGRRPAESRSARS